jgi:polygalacturonase
MKALCTVAVAVCMAATVRAAVFNPLAYGARGDGITDDTQAVRKCGQALAQANGGVFLFPSGYSFLTGSFNLTSNTVLQVAGRILGYNGISSFADAVFHYPIIPPLPWYGGGQDAQQSGAPEYEALIHSWFADNVTIVGPGLIDGQGAPWWTCKGNLAAPCYGYSRPQLMMLVHSTNINIFNITIQNSPSWTVHFANCTNVLVSNATVLAPSNSPNTDGFDIDCSVNVTVEDSFYSGGDDAIAVKSGIDYLGRTFGRTTQDIIVRRFTGMWSMFAPCM